MRAPDPGRFGVEPSAAPAVPEARRRRGRFPADPPRIVLERDTSSGREEFILDPPIHYEASVPGHRGLVRIVVPRSGSRFRTDLTSVPSWFTWLVPKSGEHLPAALIHDGLVRDDQGERTYDTVPGGIEIDRIDADRIFRDAMFDTHVGRLRCYLVWAAASVTSLMLGPRPSWTLPVRAYYWAAAFLTFGTILVLGYAATVNLADASSWPAFDVPWMVEGALPAELVTGLAGAVAIPLVLALLWGRYFPVAAIAGVAVAALFHVTLAVGAVAVVYQAAEWVLRRAERLEPPARAERALRIATVVAVVAVVACVVTVAAVWVG